MNARTLSSNHRARLLSLAGFAVLAGVVVSLGFWYYEADKEDVTQKEFQTLASIAELKSRQIQQWRKERIAEAQRAAGDALLHAAISHVLSAPGDPEFEKELDETLREEVPGQDRASAMLFDAHARLLGSSEDSAGPVNDATLKAIQKALETGRSVFSDFHRSPEGGVHVDLATPVKDGGGRLLAVLVLHHEAGSFLYPMLQSWPVPSLSAETLLVQRDGDEVVFLNDPRHRGETALSARYPLSAVHMPSVQAVLGRRGTFKGKDYRGIEVISSLLPVPGSPWFLVAKMDAEEILADVRFHSSVIILVVGLLLLLAAGLVALLYREQQNRILKNLARSEERNQDILRTAMDGFCVMDTKGRIHAVNEAYCRITGYTEKDLLTMGISDLDADMSPAMVAEQISKVLSVGQDRFETRHRRKDGSIITLDVSVQFRPDDGLIVSFFHDITKRKVAQDRIARLSMLYEAHSKSSQAIVHSSSAEELLSRICSDIVTHGGMKMAWVAMRGTADGDRVSVAAAYGDGTGYLKDIEVYLDAKSPLGRGPAGTSIREGRPVWCQDFLNDPATAPWHERGAAFGWKSCAAIPLRAGGKTVGSFLLYCEKTGAFEGDVRSLLLEMADNISFALDSFAHEAVRRKMQQDLHDALQRAEGGNRAKSEFLAMMSHELRTPLNGVLGFTDLLAATSLDDEQQHFVRTIRDSGDHLLSVVNDILDFSSIEKRGLRLEPSPLLISDLVESSGHAVQKTAADKGLEYRCEVAPGVPERAIGDQRRIRQILINLLGNAVKFTSRGSVILRVSSASDAGRPALDFSVEDTGPGIPPETVGLLFKPFTQADSTLAREFEGTGLGLAISQRLAEAMGGSITVSSTPGEGSTFTFHLPLCGDDAVTLEAPVGNPQSPTGTLALAGRLVLVAEDDRVNSMLAEKMLKSLGLMVEFASNGREAVAAFVPGKYSAIFMDIQMPEMSGLEATEKIREIEAGTGTRVSIIALTANVMPADHEQCMAAGMDDFLSKPFKKDEMAAKLARCQFSEM